MAPRHILSSRAHSDKIPTATPMFSGPYFLMVVLPVLWNVDVRQKSKMAGFGGQPTGSSNIVETTKHIIKIPTATTMFSVSTFLAVVLPISWDVDVF